jgi:amidase
VRSLADVIAYNRAHAGRALKFGQVLALRSQARDLSPDSDDTVEYKAARARDLALSKDLIDAAMVEDELAALLFAGSGSSAIGAKAGYPSIAVPAGYLASSRRPFGIAFLGRAWSEPELIGFAYDYEQAARLRRPPSVINPALFSGTSL